MKIYDPKSKRLLTGITVFLTPDEAAELAAATQVLADDPYLHNEHVANSDYSVEITVAVYTPENLQQYDEESRAIIASSISHTSWYRAAEKV